MGIIFPCAPHSAAAAEFIRKFGKVRHGSAAQFRLNTVRHGMQNIEKALLNNTAFYQNGAEALQATVEPKWEVSLVCLACNRVIDALGSFHSVSTGCCQSF